MPTTPTSRRLIAAQMYTLRDVCKTADGFRSALEILHGIGYDGVQLSAVGCMDGDNPEVSAEQAKEWLDENGLICCATHRPWDRLMHKTDAEIEFHRILGCDYVAIGGYWGHGQTLEAYQKFLAEAKPVVPALNAAGLTFAYHNHSHEFIRIPETGQWLIDYVLEQNPAIEFEMDTYWVANAGVDVVQMINRLPARLTCVHLKDQEMVPDVGGVMAPVGEGNLNWDGILPALDQAGTKWFIVEQDDCRRDQFDCLASSFDYLSQLNG